MCIHHDMMLCSLLNYMHVVVVHRLRIVMITTWNDVSDISSLYCIITVLIHQVERIL